jgi:Fe-S cluster assembly iron-binding protein IscA
MNKSFFFLLLTFCLSCNNNTKVQVDEKAASMTKQLTGEWNNLSIRIDMQSKGNSDSNEVFAIERAEWEEKLKIKPIRTFFRADSTWNSAHYNLKDSLVYNPSGKWWVEADKLTMLQDTPSPDTTIYTVILKGDTASFQCLLDWDNDGKKDDKYFGKQIKKTP